MELNTLYYLTENTELTYVSFCTSEQVLEMVEDLLIDVPLTLNYFATIFTPLFCDKKVSFFLP